MAVQHHMRQIVRGFKEAVAMMVATASSAGLTWLLWGGVHAVVFQ